MNSDISKSSLLILFNFILIRFNLDLNKIIKISELYNDSSSQSKIEASLKRMHSKLISSYFEIYDCNFCSNGYIAREKDNTPGLKEEYLYWCKNCKDHSIVGDLVYFQEDPSHNNMFDIPKKYLDRMEMLNNEDNFAFYRIDGFSSIMNREILIINEIEKKIESEIKNYLLIEVKFENGIDNIDINWNKIALLNHNFVRTKEGKKLLTEKIKQAVYGICPNCNNNLIPSPFHRTKPYIESLKFYCVSCKKSVGYLKDIDAACFSGWCDPTNIEL